MKKEVQLRAPIIADAQRIASLSSELGYEVSVDEIAGRITTLLQRDDHHLAVSIVDGEVAGWVQVHVCTYIESGYRA